MKLIIFSITLVWVILIFILVHMFRLTRMMNNFLIRLRALNNIDVKRQITKGTKTPVFKVRDYKNRKIIINHEMDSDVLILFTKSSCSVCKEILSNINKMANTKLNDLKVIIVTDILTEGILKNNNFKDITLISDNNIIQLYEVEIVPCIIIINKKGIIEGRNELKSFMEFKKVINDYLLKTAN